MKLLSNKIQKNISFDPSFLNTIYLKKGGEVKPTGNAIGKKPIINNKQMPNNGDENSIPIGDNKSDNNKKIYKPKQQENTTTKKPLSKKQQGGNLNFNGKPIITNEYFDGKTLGVDWNKMHNMKLNFGNTKNGNPITLSRTVTTYLNNKPDTIYNGNDLNGDFFSYNNKDNPKEYNELKNKFNSFLKTNSYKKGGKMNKKCSCGCSMKISKNEKGGLIEVCSCKCGGKMKKKH